MTPHTFYERLIYWLQTFVWPGTTNLVFGEYGVHFTPELAVTQLSKWPSPYVNVIDAGEISHPEHPGIVTQEFTLVTFIENYGEAYGDSALLGGNRPEANASSGAGLKEIEAVTLKALQALTSLSNSLGTDPQKVCLLCKSRTKKQFMKENLTCTIGNSVFHAVNLGVY